MATQATVVLPKHVDAEAFEACQRTDHLDSAVGVADSRELVVAAPESCNQCCERLDEAWREVAACSEHRLVKQHHRHRQHRSHHLALVH